MFSFNFEIWKRDLIFLIRKDIFEKDQIRTDEGGWMVSLGGARGGRG